MARAVIRQLLKRKLSSHSQSTPGLYYLIAKRSDVISDIDSVGKKSLRGLALLGAGVSGLLSFATVASAEHGSEGPIYPWPGHEILSSLDNGTVRRGQKVFQHDCSACHGIAMASYRDLAGATYTDEEIKAMMAEIEVVHGPNDKAQILVCPAKHDQAVKKGKDVETPLAWATEAEMEEKKLMGFKWVLVFSLALLQAAY